MNAPRILGLRVFSTLLASSALFVAWSSTSGDIKLPKVFSDNMVLQRGERINVWGTADPNETLTIRLGDQSVEIAADASGAWSARIQPPVGVGPFELEIKGANTRIVFQNVLIGEVWLCAGQINMHSTIGQFPGAANLEIGKTNLRYFQVKETSVDHPQSDYGDVSGWQEPGPEAVRDFSAIAVLFGREVSETLNVPVGLISASTIDGNCESWVPWSALAASHRVDSLLADWNGNDLDRLNKNRPGNLFNGMINPLSPLSIRGVVWYQGESDVGREKLFQDCFPTLISSWREVFQLPKMPFYFVQLAPFRYTERAPDDLPKLWEIQSRCGKLADAGLAVTADLGATPELDGVDKQVVADRLAKIALVKCYGRSADVVSGPVFASQKTEGNKIRLTFENANGLHALEQSASLFQIADKDRKFVSAHAELSGSDIVIWSDEIENPVAVRYAWSDTAQSNWLNAADLPMFPFRTSGIDEESVSDAGDLER